MRKILQAITLGTSLLITSPQIASAQDTEEEISIRIDRISREEAKNRLNFVQFRISRLSSSENLAKDYQEIKNELSELLEKSDDRKIKYDANFFVARLIFEKDKRTFSETFSFLEKCIFDYSNEEEKYGLAYDALSKINDKFSKEKRLIGISRTYELAQLSPYPKKDLRSLKSNLNSILNTEIGELHLRKSLEKIFSPDKVKEYASFNEHENMYVAPLPKGYGSALSGPKTEIKEVRISSNAEIFPTIKIKNVNIYRDPIFSFYRHRINVTNNIKRKCEKYGGRDSLSKRQYDLIKELSQDWATTLNYNGIVVDEDDIHRYITGYMGHKKVMGFIYPIVVKEGVKIRDLLKRGGIDPYNWCYKNTQEIEW